MRATEFHQIGISKVTLIMFSVLHYDPENCVHFQLRPVYFEACYSLEALSMDDRRSRCIVLLFADPHLLECGE